MTHESTSVSSSAEYLDYEFEVASLARQYYEEQGCPEGQSLEHWARAEREIRRRMQAVEPDTWSGE